MTPNFGTRIKIIKTQRSKSSSGYAEDWKSLFLCFINCCESESMHTCQRPVSDASFDTVACFSVSHLLLSSTSTLPSFKKGLPTIGWVVVNGRIRTLVVAEFVDPKPYFDLRHVRSPTLGI